MKISYLVIFLFLANACSKSALSVDLNSEVDTFVDLLRNNQYEETSLPEFTPDHIPALLAYRNEEKIISKFPINQISSFYVSTCSLGIYILWTIESIRAVEIQSNLLIGRFPSLNPLLALKGSPEVIMQSEYQKMAADAYFNWWNGNSKEKVNELMKIDPLGTTLLKWR